MLLTHNMEYDSCKDFQAQQWQQSYISSQTLSLVLRLSALPRRMRFPHQCKDLCWSLYLILLYRTNVKTIYTFTQITFSRLYYVPRRIINLETDEISFSLVFLFPVTHICSFWYSLLILHLPCTTSEHDPPTSKSADQRNGRAGTRRFKLLRTSCSRFAVHARDDWGQPLPHTTKFFQ